MRTRKTKLRPALAKTNARNLSLGASHLTNHQIDSTEMLTKPDLDPDIAIPNSSVKSKKIQNVRLTFCSPNKYTNDAIDMTSKVAR